MGTTMYAVSVALFLAVGVGIVHGQCTEEAVTREVNECLKEFYAVTDFTSTFSSFSAVRLRNFCETSADREIQCAENLRDRCRNVNSDAKDILNKTINAVRGSVKTVCDPNTRAALKAKEECLTKHAAEVGICIQGARSLYRSYAAHFKLMDQAENMGDEWVKRRTFDKFCNMTATIKNCQAKFGKYCGDNIQLFYDALNEVTNPPACSADAVGIGWLVVTILAFVVTLRENLST